MLKFLWSSIFSISQIEKAFASIKLSCNIVSYIDLANRQSYNLRNRNSSATIYEESVMIWIFTARYTYACEYKHNAISNLHSAKENAIVSVK